MISMNQIKEVEAPNTHFASVLMTFTSLKAFALEVQA